MVKKYSELYMDARRALLPSEGERAGALARELLALASGQSVERVTAHKEMYASEEVERRLNSLVARTLDGEPLAYLLGFWPFHGLKLTITPDVLIPRDDTEVVTELAVHVLKLSPVENPRVLDLCTGSGCIGLAIASEIPDARVTLGDVSDAALKVARQNIQSLHFTGRVKALKLDAMEPASAFLGKYDMIVANPPYVTETEMEQLDRSVKDYEPHLALNGGADGLDFYRAILENYLGALQKGGFLAFEFGQGQKEAVCALLQERDLKIIVVKEDTGGIPRAVLAMDPREDVV